MKHTQNIRAFTLIEMIVSITIFAVIIIMAFSAMGSIGILRNGISNRLDLNTELYSATEKIIEIIKTGGDIDYEEYWNRQVVGTSMSSGHYDVFSGFGNYGSGSGYGDGLYYCRSGNGMPLGIGGCLNKLNTYGDATSLLGIKQRYGEYKEQFIDYNSNMNNDGSIPGDENGDGNVRGDDDDEEVAMGPSAFSGGFGTKELYLIKKGQNPERTYLRWIIKQDPNGPLSTPCILSGANMGSGNCLGNIQVLKMVGRDLGIAHTGNSAGKYDGIIDTWECREDFNCPSANMPNNRDDGWVDIFPDWVNVKDVNFYPYPEKDFRYAWKEQNDAMVLNSYVRLKITLGLGWEKRKKVKGPSGDITLMTTVNLSR